MTLLSDQDWYTESEVKSYVEVDKRLLSSASFYAVENYTIQVLQF